MHMTFVTLDLCQHLDLKTMVMWSAFSPTAQKIRAQFLQASKFLSSCTARKDKNNFKKAVIILKRAIVFIQSPL